MLNPYFDIMSDVLSAIDRGLEKDWGIKGYTFDCGIEVYYIIHNKEYVYWYKDYPVSREFAKRHIAKHKTKLAEIL